MLGTVAVPVFAKHVENLRRISEGRELKIDFVWDREGELKRTGLEEQAEKIDRGEIPDKVILPPMPKTE